MFKLLATAVILLSAYTTALPNCANYPDVYFINDPSNCQAYWFCADPQSAPIPDRCPLPYNFDQANQLCNHPDEFPCSDFGAVAVREHNYYRDLHGVPHVASFNLDVG